MTEVQAKAMSVSEMGWFFHVRSPLSPRGKLLMNAFEIKKKKSEDSAGLDDDGVHLPIRVVERDSHRGFSEAKMRGRTNRKKFGQALNNAQEY